MLFVLLVLFVAKLLFYVDFIQANTSPSGADNLGYETDVCDKKSVGGGEASRQDGEGVVEEARLDGEAEAGEA